MRGEVTAAWEASHPDPIVLAAGDRVAVERRDSPWPEYRWCAAPDGREGWVPAEILTETAAGWVAALPYDARELTVEAGDIVEAMRLLAGWWWCRSSDGSEGWIPAEVLSFPGA